MASTNYEQRIIAIESMLAEVLAILKQDQDKPNTLPQQTPDVSIHLDKAKKNKKVKLDSDTPKKKRSPTGYLVFSNANRDMVKQHLSDIDESVNPKDVTRELARRWKLLSDEERDDWNSKAKSSLDADSTD